MVSKVGTGSVNKLHPTSSDSLEGRQVFHWQACSLKYTSEFRWWHHEAKSDPLTKQDHCSLYCYTEPVSSIERDRPISPAHLGKPCFPEDQQALEVRSWINRPNLDRLLGHYSNSRTVDELKKDLKDLAIFRQVYPLELLMFFHSFR